MDRLPDPNPAAAEELLRKQRLESLQRTSHDGAMALASRGIGEKFVLGEREGICGLHGAFTETGYRLSRITREFWSGCHSCKQIEEEARAEHEARQQAERLARRREADIGAAAIPERFKDRTFDAFVADTPEKQRALTVAREYAEDFAENDRHGRGLVFIGSPGTGKSHLAASIALHLIDGRRWVQYTTCMGLIRAVRDTWRSDSETSEAKVLRKFGSEIDLLILDEVGVQYGTDSEQNILFEVLDRRYGDMRSTVILTNQKKEGLKKYVGDRVYDRLTETGRMVVFDWPSYRKQARAA